MSQNIKEAIVFFLPLLVVVATIIVGILTLTKDSRKQNKARYEHGKQIGALAARDIGCAKAYKIANELPECAYKDGYVEGIASIEDAMQRNL